jgi:hypothetical protein
MKNWSRFSQKEQANIYPEIFSAILKPTQRLEWNSNQALAKETRNVLTPFIFSLQYS